MKAKIKSPLRYPGGKSRAVEQIAARLPATFTEYREPFVGGGSLFINLRQRRPDVAVWINDLNFDLFCFWQHAQNDLAQLTEEVRRIKQREMDGRKLFQELTNSYDDALSTFERAVRFFVLNRITFSGTVDSGGFSQKAFETRFTDSSIERLAQLRIVLEDVCITNLDYKEILSAPGADVFLFLDPPYLRATKSKLYGRRGALHTNFDHTEFTERLRECPHRWLVTYDDTPEIHRNFRFANIYNWELQYGMNNYGRTFAPKGKELFITNYEASLSANETEEDLTLAFGD